MITERLEKILLSFAGISLFIEMVALMSLQASAVYVFGGTAILFAILALIVYFVF